MAEHEAPDEEQRVARYADLPLATRRFLETLDFYGDGERVRCLLLAADVFGSFDANTLAMLRSLARKPELVSFLADVRKEEVEELENAIELVRSMRRTGKLARWGLATLAAATVGASMLWDKFSAFFKIVASGSGKQ